MKVKIYTLVDPREPYNIRYVGKTWLRSTTRYNAHLRAAKSGKPSHVNAWIRTLLKENSQPLQENIEEVDFDVWKEREIYWIEQFKQWGFKLTNICKGGMDSGRRKGHKSNVSEEVRQRMNKEHSIRMLGNTYNIYNSKENKMKSIMMANEKAKKPVIEIDCFGKTVNIYASITEASLMNSISKDRISSVCNKKQKSTGGRIFRFLN